MMKLVRLVDEVQLGGADWSGWASCSSTVVLGVENWQRKGAHGAAVMEELMMNGGIGREHRLVALN
jgi:hypothetical protein